MNGCDTRRLSVTSANPERLAEKLHGLLLLRPLSVQGLRERLHCLSLLLLLLPLLQCLLLLRVLHRLAAMVLVPECAYRK